LINYKFILYLDCWNYEPDGRPTINQVVSRLNAIISDFKQNDSNADIQLSSKENIKNSLHEKMFQIIQNYSEINIKEIEPSISSNLAINDFSMVVSEITHFLENIETRRRKYEIINYLNNLNIISQEFYGWLLNNQDNPDSAFLLGVFYHFGITINIDKQKAFKFYQNAANLGNIPGIIGLGYCYEEGIGSIIDKQKAFELYKEAANLGNPRGINNLGSCYDCGIGTSVDKKKAFKLYQKAMNLGNILAVCNLGYCYDEGIGTIIDKQKAFELYQKGSNLGNSTAKYNLASMYENGIGVKKSICQAIYWYNESSKQGDQDAQKKLSSLI
jgi:TPR repeat protein